MPHTRGARASAYRAVASLRIARHRAPSPRMAFPGTPRGNAEVHHTCSRSGLPDSRRPVRPSRVQANSSRLTVSASLIRHIMSMAHDVSGSFITSMPWRIVRTTQDGGPTPRPLSQLRRSAFSTACPHSGHTFAEMPSKLYWQRTHTPARLRTARLADHRHATPPTSMAGPAGQIEYSRAHALPAL
jgi:hypothetical protein